MPKATRTAEQTRLAREERQALKKRLASARDEYNAQIQDISRTSILERRAGLADNSILVVP